MPLISFCIPFYSGIQYLQKAIDSVRRQTVQDWRLYIVDDCGPETTTAEVVQSYNDKRISYFRNEKNLGLAGNWNRCLELAPKGLVTLLHSDDELKETYAEAMLRANALHPEASAYFCRAEIIGEAGLRKFSFPDFVKLFLMPSRSEVITLNGQRALLSVLKGNFIFCPSLCYNHDNYKNLRFSSSWKMVLDLDLIARILMEGQTIIGLPDKLYRYRRHSSNQTVQLTESMVRFDEEISFYREIGAKTKSLGWGEASSEAFHLRIVKLHLLYLVSHDLILGRWQSLGKKFSYLKKNNLLKVR